MHRNPYTPPTSPVADIPIGAGNRPRNVVLAVAIAFGSIAVGLLKGAVTPSNGPLWIGAVIIVIILALLYAVWARQGWARWIFLVMFVLGLLVTFLVREVLFQQGWLSVAIMAVQTIAQGAALIYMFTPSSNAWYRRASAT